MPKPDLTRSGFRGPRSSNDLARAKAKLQAFKLFPKVITGGAGSASAASASSLTYNVSPAASNVDEGNPLTINVTTSNVPDGTTLYWTIGNNAGDFGTTSGDFNINSNAGSFTVTPTADSATEGSQTFTVQIRTSSGGTVVDTTDAITINDTSTGSAATYSVAGASSSVNEGSALTINVTTTNVSDGTTLYWTIGSNAGEFGQASGGFTVNSNAGSFTVTPTADSATEGSETFTVQIRTNNTNGSIVATTSSITINDTSTGSASPTYDATPTATSIDEGSALTINVTTSNVPDGTTLYWTILGNTGDFSTQADTFSINSDAGSFTVTPTADATTEGTTETFQVQIRTGSTGGTVVDTTDAITINDTSQTPAFSPDYTLSVSHGTTGYYTLVGTDRSGSINGDNPALAFNAGDKVRFSNSVSGNHPLYIKTVQGTGTGNQASGVSGAGTATVDWTIPAGSGTYYYQCSVHSNMVGTITVTSGSGY